MAENNKQPAAITPLANNPRTGAVGVGQSLISALGGNILNKYNINTAIYPIDLFSPQNPYGDNYVVFYINVPEASKLASEGLVNVVDRDTVELGSAIAKSSSGAINAIAEKLQVDKSLVQSRQTKRITDTITLNIPNNLVSRYAVTWDVEDIMLGSAAADIANALANKSSAQSAGNAAAGAAANIALNKMPGAGAASAMTGLAANPKKEQLFKNVDFRTFNFEYQFSPRNEQESKSIDKIIKLFKLHMHPEFKDSAGFLFLYPSEFEIVYYQGNEENMNLPRHTSSVLVDMSVNYTPQGMYNTFNDGASTLITLNLTFKELAILTKAEILDGF